MLGTRCRGTLPAPRSDVRTSSCVQRILIQGRRGPDVVESTLLSPPAAAQLGNSLVDLVPRRTKPGSARPLDTGCLPPSSPHTTSARTGTKPRSWLSARGPPLIRHFLEPDDAVSRISSFCLGEVAFVWPPRSQRSGERLQTPLRAGLHQARGAEGGSDMGPLVSVPVQWPGPGVAPRAGPSSFRQQRKLTPSALPHDRAM